MFDEAKSQIWLKKVEKAKNGSAELEKIINDAWDKLISSDDKSERMFLAGLIRVQNDRR